MSGFLLCEPHLFGFCECKRYWVEKPFGWMKTVGALRKVKFRGRDKLWCLFTFTASAFNLWRIPQLKAAAC